MTDRPKRQAERMAERAERVLQLHALGWNYRRIAAELRIDFQAAQKCGWRLGLKGHRDHNVRLHISREEYMSEKARGWSDDAIAAARGVTRSCIGHKVKREGWR